MRKLKLGWLVSIPVIALIALFAASNTGATTLQLWPLPPEYGLAMPVFLPILVAGAAGYLWGAAGMWLRQHRFRKVARRQFRHQRKEARARHKQGLPREAPKVTPADALARLAKVAVKEPPRAPMAAAAPADAPPRDMVA